MAAAVTVPFKWLGGKSKLVRKLLPLLPPHRVYVEAFGGTAALLLAKPPSPVEVFNDVDSGVVTFFRVLRDPVKCERFLQMARLTPYSREEWYACRDSWRRVEDDVERAWAWFVVARMSFGGIFGKSWGFSAKPARGVAEPVSQWLGAVDALPEVAERFRRVIVENRDFRELVPLHDGPDTCFYCLTREALVRMADERLVPIGDIRPGDTLFGGREVLRILSRWYVGRVLSIKVQGLPDPLLVTPQHRILRIPKRNSKRQEQRTSQGLWSRRELVPASALEVGDYVLIPLGGAETEVHWDWRDNPVKWGKRRPDVRFTPCPELFRFLGYYAAQGHIERGANHQAQMVVLSFDIRKADTVARDAAWCVERAFGFSPKIKFGRPHPSVVQVHIYSTSVAEFVERYVPGTAATKRVSVPLMTAPIAGQREILIGWLRGDGHLASEPRNRVKLLGTTASEELARQMFLLALRCGLRPSFKRRARENPKWKTAYDVYFAAEDAARLGFDVPCRRFRSTRRIINGHMLARIRAVAQREYEGIVYDLDVTQDDTFAAPFVLVHNCDPPYIPDTRRAGSYAHEMSLDDHRDLVRLLLRLEGMAILSGYRHPVYAPLEEAGWARLDFPAACHAAGRTRASGLRGEGACLERQRRVESVWLSPRARAAAGRGRQLDLRDLEADCESAETMIS